MPLSIRTLPPEQLAPFLMRYRRGETLERFEPRLDHFLREILAKANEFVPSEAGAILLDDPRAKIRGGAPTQLVLIATFGGQGHAVGERVNLDRGLVSQVYASGRSRRCIIEEGTDDPAGDADQETPGGLQARSMLGVPVIMGSSVCGVIQLINRLERPTYSEEESKLIEIFAGYISSSIQNILDGIRAKELARRDDLTGLFNDRYFHFRLREEIGRASAAGTDLALIFLDLDRFKEINDQLGHLEGSRTLHELGLLLEHGVPPGSVVARYGGDEFVIILPGAGEADARRLAELLLRTIGEAHLPSHPSAAVERELPALGASIGVASLHNIEAGEVTKRANALIRLADGAMYRAKAEGRNRVIVAHPQG